MPKPPPKVEQEAVTNARPPGGKAYKTRSVAASEADDDETPGNSEVIDLSPQAADTPVAPKKQADSERSHNNSPMNKIAMALIHIIKNEKLNKSAKESLEEVVTYARGEEGKEAERQVKAEEYAIASALRKSIRTDLEEMYGLLAKKLNGIQDTTNAVLTSSDKLCKDTESVTVATKDLASKMGKVTDATDKIATETTKYRDAVLAKPSQSPQTNRAFTDPKVLGDMERKACQLLVDLFDKEGCNTLDKSITELIAKANEAIESIDDSGKPKGIKAEAIYKTRRGALLLTLNSKEAARWMRQTDIEMTFTEAFAEGSQIRDRNYNLVVPRVPTTFNPKDDKQLRELEEENGLGMHEALKAKWIKPLERRRPGQTHAYALLTISSVDSANRLIRDGLNIGKTRVRPTKQKQEPVQCMKCRRWGHFANECQAEKDTCGTCGEAHRTSACTNTGKTSCVACKVDSHASWSRMCPEFNRRCAIYDERNPENALPYFPTEHDWTLTPRPDRIPTDERFPNRFAVNSLPIAVTRREAPGPRQQRRSNGEHPTRNSQKRAPPLADKAAKENPNLIPLNRGKEKGESAGAGKQSSQNPKGSAFAWDGTDEEHYLAEELEKWN
jgi:hypothetical protein